MPKYWKDGKENKVRAIYRNGRVGQVVILDNVSYGNSPDFDKYPLARYPQPTIFTIVEKTEGKDGHYVVLDPKGNRLVLRDEDHGASEPNLFDASEWFAWNAMRERDKLASKERRIEQLEGQLALLKDILTKQGFRIVSMEQAEKLGIEINHSFYIKS